MCDWKRVAVRSGSLGVVVYCCNALYFTYPPGFVFLTGLAITLFILGKI